MGEFPGLTLEWCINADIRDLDFFAQEAQKREGIRRQLQLYYARLAFVGGEPYQEEMVGLDWLVNAEEKAAQASPLIEEEKKKD